MHRFERAPDPSDALREVRVAVTAHIAVCQQFLLTANELSKEDNGERSVAMRTF
jgi:hypothetical protein